MKISKVMLVKVLIFAVFAGAMTVALGVKLANARLFADTYSLEAEFEDATGVLLGDAVKLAGVDVGRVESFRIENGKAVVRFNLDESVEMPKDSTVAIKWRNVLGQRFLYVYPGDDAELFADGDRVPVEQTEDVSDIGEFLNRIGPVLKAIDPEEANAFLDAVNTALTGNEQEVRQLIDDGAKLASTLAGEDEEIKDLIGSADEIMHAYATQDEAIGSIFDDLDDIGTVLARRTEDINSLVSDFSVVQRELNELLQRNRGNIDTSLDSLRQVAGTFAKSEARLEETLDTTPLGMANYFQTTSWGQWFNVRIIEVQVKDSNSEFVLRERERDDQHADKGGSPTVGDGAGNGYKKDKDGDDRWPKGNPDGGNKEGKDGRRSRRSAEGIEAVLRFVLMGDYR